MAKDLRKIDPPLVRDILRNIETDLAANPGKDKALTGTFLGLFSYRVGDFRVIYSLHETTILILRIAHRKDAYKKDPPSLD